MKHLHKLWYIKVDRIRIGSPITSVARDSTVSHSRTFLVRTTGFVTSTHKQQATGGGKNEDASSLLILEPLIDIKLPIFNIHHVRGASLSTV
jgi:hypothetical protein